MKIGGKGKHPFIHSFFDGRNMMEPRGGSGVLFQREFHSNNQIDAKGMIHTTLKGRKKEFHLLRKNLETN